MYNCPDQQLYKINYIKMGNFCSSSDKLEITFTKKNKGGVKGNEVEFSSDSAADFLDVVFCIDTTGSMSAYIERSKKVITNMINFFQLNEEKPLFGVVAYREHPPRLEDYVTKIHDLSEAEEALNFVNGLSALGGADECEAVLQGLYDSITKIQWRNLKIKEKTYKKLLIHVGDAPPHGKQFHYHSIDDYPNGCPSKISLETLAAAFNDNNIYYHFCRLNKTTDIMCERFYRSFKNFELLDLMVTIENMQEQKKEFEDYVYNHKVSEYANKKFECMDSREQNECLYEARVTNMLVKNMKK